MLSSIDFNLQRLVISAKYHDAFAPFLYFPRFFRATATHNIQRDRSSSVTRASAFLAFIAGAPKKGKEKKMIEQTGRRERFRLPGRAPDALRRQAPRADCRHMPHEH